MIQSWLRRVKRPFIVLLTVPASIAIIIGALPFPINLFEEALFETGRATLTSISAETARSLLTAIASGAMTTLSLTYSLVLLVFTLAAGNIGPRLLKRFTSDLVNQVTAGIFGGTFLFCLAALSQISAPSPLQLNLLVACFLAVVSVLQLIYFVRHVSKSVTIDDEIVEITKRLMSELREQFSRNERQDGNGENTPKIDTEIIKARSAGYIGLIDRARLLEIAREQDVVFELKKPGGEFVTKSEMILTTSGKDTEILGDDAKDLVQIEHTRSENMPIEFSLNLLVEIALRALSPGINDTYTAVAVVDSLSSTFANVAEYDGSVELIRDADDNIRLVIPSRSFKSLFGQAFHPLRRASKDNILMAQALARAYSRISVAGSEDVLSVVKNHANLLVKDLKAAGRHSPSDLESVQEYLTSKLR